MVDRALAKLARAADGDGIDARFDGVAAKAGLCAAAVRGASDFDEVAFRRVRKNFQCLVQFFNEFADLTGQSPLQLESSPPLRTDTDFATFINDDWRGLDDAEAE